MKSIRNFIIVLLAGLASWSCSSDLSNTALKATLQENADNLNLALQKITSSKGYQVLSTTGSDASKVVSNVSGVSIDSTYSTILLADITGEYEFNKANTYKRWKQPITNFFSKSAENSSVMIVRLPKEKVQKPGSLFMYNPADTLLTNNYVFTLNKYNYTFNKYLGWDYDMASNIQIESVNAGDLSIQSGNSKTSGYRFASQFAFADGYTTRCTYSLGDSAVSVYAVYKDDKALYEEKYTAVKSSGSNRHREREYTLTIGDVKIVRNQGKNSLDSAKVYVNNVLQSAAKVEVVDIATDDATDVSVTNKKRELKITFEDGTSKTISELLGTSVITIRNLFQSLRQSYFATDIVDRIAWNIYVSKN